MTEASTADLWRRLLVGSSGDVGTPRLLGDDAAPASADDARIALARPRKALEEAGLSVLFVVNSVVIDEYWLAWLKRLVNGNPARRRDYAFVGDLRCGLSVLAELRSSTRDP